MRTDKKLSNALIVLLAGLLLTGCSGPKRGYRLVRRGGMKYPYACGSPRVYPFVEYPRPEAKNKHGIHYAAWRGDLDRIKSLLAQNPELVNANRGEHFGIGTPLHWSTFAGHKDIVKLLITKGADVNRTFTNMVETPLHVAAVKGNKEIAKLLIANGADINAGGTVRGSHSVLRYALFWGQKNQRDIAKLLIANGADINASILGNWQETLLHAAASCHREDVAEFLIANGADVNAKNGDGDTPLRLAAEDGQRSIAELLIANGADVNAKGKHGFTPLHSAAGRGHKTLVQLLVANGADVNAKSAVGRTPLDHARDNKDIARILRKYGAVRGTRRPNKLELQD